MAPHTGSATPEQIDTLLNFLDEHRDLARGKLRSIEGKVQAKRLWEELCNILNSMGGCTKTVRQWQKVWFDSKHLARKVISIMGDGFGGRQTKARVPAFSETNDEPLQSTSSQADQPPSLSRPLSRMHLPEEVVEPAVPRQLLEPVSQPVSQESCTARSSQSANLRRRQSAATSSSVRSRLYQFEEERAERETIRNNELAGIRAELTGINAPLMAELTGIKAALIQMFGLIRELLDNRN